MSDDELTYDPLARSGSHFPNHGQHPPVLSPLVPEPINPPGPDGLSYRPNHAAAQTPATAGSVQLASSQDNDGLTYYPSQGGFVSPAAPAHFPNAPAYRRELDDGLTYTPPALSDAQAPTGQTAVQTASFAPPPPKKAPKFEI